MRRLLDSISEAWRERASERRAAKAPRVAADPKVPRSRLQAAFDARQAVRAGVRLDDFLRHRLARYAVRLPIPLEALPVSVDIEGGEAVVRRRPPPRAPAPGATAAPAPAPAAGGERPFRALVARDGPWAARELQDRERALDALDARAEEARRRLDAVEAEISDALAGGRIVAPPDVEASPEQLGRPPVASPLPALALRAFAGVLLAAEAWRFSGPVLEASGLAPDGLQAALRGSPLAAGLGLAFALGAAAAVFGFAALALSRGAAAMGTGKDGTRRPLLGTTAVGAALLAAGVAAAAAAPDRWAHLALLVAVPFAGALAWRAADALAAARAGAERDALEWDRARAQEALDRGRREALRARAAADLRAVETERAATRRALRRLHALALSAERSAQLARTAEATRLDRLSEGLAAALELDRYLYLRLAAERSLAPLARPARPARIEGGVPAERLGVAG